MTSMAIPSSVSLTEYVYRLLKEEILRVERPPGDLLSELELATRYGVSKTPVREALRLLAQDGWVVVLPRKGYLIRPLRLDDVREIFALRTLIEPGIAMQAAGAVTPAELAELQALVDKQAEAVDDLSGALNAATLFHLAIAQISGNRRVLKIVGELLDEVRRLHFLLPNVESHITSNEELQAHRCLVDALGARESERAANIMHTHLNQVARTLVQGFSGLSPG